MKFIIARAIAGHIEDKKFYAILGNPNCGKGTITIGLNYTFDKYMGEWNINNIKYNPKSGTDEAKKLSWLSPLKNVRCAFSNESRMDRSNIDGNLIKTLASGGDSIIMRQNFKDETQYVFPTTFFYFGNDIATISPRDKAIEVRMRFIRFVKEFVDKPIEECSALEMPADPTIKSKLKTRQYRSALFWIIMNSYKPNYVDVKEPQDVIEETQENIIVEEKELKKLLQEEYEFTGDDEDYVISRDITSYLKRMGVNMSDTKIGRELRNLGLKKKDKKIDGKTNVVYIGIRR
jgi:phage/plasmid-associated DNA primase